MTDMFDKLKQLISEAEEYGILTPAHGVSGYSGKKVIGLLQRLARFQEENRGGGYLEVGVFQGLSLISVAKVLSNERAFGIDNFSQFDPDHKNRDLVMERMGLNDIANATLINMDFEEALLSLEDHVPHSKIGLYFVDGPHDYRSQFMCLELIKPHLSDTAVIVVDDSNYRHVRQANRDFLICNPEFKMLFEAYTDGHPVNMDAETRIEATNGWWNGINVIVKDIGNELVPMYPPTLKNKTLFLNEHIVHSSRHAVLAPNALRFVSSLLDFRLARAFRSFIRIVMQSKKASGEFQANHLSANTFSDALPKYNINPSLTVAN